MKLDELVRPAVRRMQAYSSARDEFHGQASIMLDANENSLGSAGGGPFNRYPDPHQRLLRARLATLNGVTAEQVFVGNGSDEAIDLLLRLTCRPGQDRIAITPPTYGMYEVSAALNEVQVETVPLNAEFQLDDAAIEQLLAIDAKLVFLCSPNNPTGNLLHAAAVERIARQARALVVIDEAYIDFANAPSWASRLDELPNLVVLRTLSKAWGLAALRVGVCLGSAELIAYLDKIKPPYNLSTIAQQLALEGLHDTQRFTALRDQLLEQRAWLRQRLEACPLVAKVFPSDANFLLVRLSRDATTVYRALLAHGIVVRNRSGQPGCHDCLRITVGSAEENQALMLALEALAQEDRTP